MPALNYYRMPGPGDLPGDSRHPNSPDYDAAWDEAQDEAVSELVDEYRDDPAKLRGAAEWTAGSFDDEHYTELTLALHALHSIEPDKLVGSDVLATLYRLAKVEHAELERQLRELATVDLQGRTAA